ncbi:SDR family NAD(P)-dependent oxidoreductase [Nitrosovibrio sp. Nv17]|jgi:NADP-dependent 3-hydroxy acid dehydrogenase YdfG|uniref:SDR family NAD(P)-dependent oxidoreductase n=1 Tax=Nitrosovibrio sp. Nv17 TaxID=1855339 RepID=UPI0009087A6F|nr:SDR family NAD(P)-dependent oxidoreductase [Nitrosovibrio sp. Nv17]SFW21620.1 NADP-dependent 3-hydroxy acid dehydrogenase YdfG [Nitrosovibrio sp. Nv17]
MDKGVCAVVGVGHGNGAAMARHFAMQGYRVALCARDLPKLREISATIAGSMPFEYDVRDVEGISGAFAGIRQQLGPVDVLVYNAGAGAFANIDDATVEDFQAAWEVNCRGLFLAAKAVIPDMRAAGGGCIVAIGATASLRGGAGFAPFASAKAGQRGLAQSLARHLWPENIHVAYVILDGIVNLERTRARLADRPDDFFLEPSRIAESVYFLSQQDRQAWTFELDLRPYAEKW